MRDGKRGMEKVGRTVPRSFSTVGSPYPGSKSHDPTARWQNLSEGVKKDTLNTAERVPRHPETVRTRTRYGTRSQGDIP